METQVGPGAETTEECTHSASILKQPWFPCPEMVLATVDVVLSYPISIINQNNPSRTCPQTMSDQGNSSVKVASFQMTLGCVKLMIKANQENVFKLFLHLRSGAGVSTTWHHSLLVWGLEEV